VITETGVPAPELRRFTLRTPGGPVWCQNSSAPKSKDSSHDAGGRLACRSTTVANYDGVDMGIAALRFLLMFFSGWVHRGQLAVIDFLKEKNWVLREQLGGWAPATTESRRELLRARHLDEPDGRYLKSSAAWRPNPTLSSSDWCPIEFGTRREPPTGIELLDIGHSHASRGDHRVGDASVSYLHQCINAHIPCSACRPARAVRSRRATRRLGGLADRRPRLTSRPSRGAPSPGAASAGVASVSSRYTREARPHGCATRRRRANVGACGARQSETTA
jgi:hypothetical protein